MRRSKMDVLGPGEWVPLYSVQGPAYPVRVVTEFKLVGHRGSGVLGWLSGFLISISVCFKEMFAACEG